MNQIWPRMFQAPSNHGGVLERDKVEEQYKWDLSHIYADWAGWEADYQRLETMIGDMASLQGTLASGPKELLHALRLNDETDQLAYRVWFYPSLMADEDVRKNDIDAKRQEVSLLFARSSTATAWFNPELLAIPLKTVRDWMDADEELALYRFAIENLYRQQEHVLDQNSEKLLSYWASFNGSPKDVYSMLSTADIDYPTISLSSGEEVKLSYGRYYSILSKERRQEDRARAFQGLYGTFAANVNTYAAIYNAICQKDWAGSQARNYTSTLQSALHGDNIPTSVVENLLSTTRAGVAPLQRYYALRKKVLGLQEIHLYDGTIPLLEIDPHYDYEDSVELVLESVRPLGAPYHAKMTEAFQNRWVDVHESEGKRTGAYSAPVYGVHPYVLLNYNSTLDNVFTVAHELGHTMHSVLSHAAQPFCYAEYTIFVAEVASTLNERLLLGHMLQRTSDPKARILLLQHAIDSIVGTFYSQVLFADFEVEAHRMVERGEPITADSLNELYTRLQRHYYGDVVTHDELYQITWARIPHLFRSPFYVYQYATCFASSAQIFKAIEAEGDIAVERYLELLRSGGNDYPMEQLKRAGVDLNQPGPVQAVVEQLDELVTQLESEFARL